MRIFLIIIEFFVGITAILGGLALIFNMMGVPLSDLAGSPFPSFFWPGLILALVVGGTNLLGGISLIRRHELAPEASAIAGFGLLIWIFTEVYMIQGAHWLQILYFVLGMVILIFTFFLLRFQKETRIPSYSERKNIFYVVVALIVLFFAVSSFVFVTNFRRLYTGGAFSRPTYGRRGSFTFTDVNFIRDWMTFDYVNKAFAIDPNYLRIKLDISNDDYPNVTIGRIARQKKIPTNQFLETVRNAVKENMTSQPR